MDRCDDLESQNLGHYGWNIGDANREFIENEINFEPTPNTPAFPDTKLAGGHYWCQSNGGIPPGAIKAGVDKDGGDVYVGRAFHQGEVLPAKIIINQNVAYIAWGGEEHPKHDFEVLCRGNCVVIWQEDRGGSVPPGAVPVGSTADNERLYIGRVFHDGTLTPGKIHPSHGVCYIPYDGQELSFSTYEVLILN